jgi:hypothetical protein
MNRLHSVTLMGLLAMAPIAGFGQGTAPPPAAQPASPSGDPAAAPAVTYSTGQLDQMLAPIALYPDTLLGQILMASTYPIQIVEAERWLEVPANAAMHGDQLVAALQPLQWDPSVKSLIPFPQIVKQMGDQLDWTQSLGTAFVNQQAAVMAEVQVLRHQCEANGKLVTTEQQRVRHDGANVIIEPVNPAVVYVPVYNPVEVYGPWAYAAYPPFYFPPYPGFFVGPVGIGIGFSIGFGVVGPLWGWSYPIWGGGGIFIDGGRFSQISYNHAGFVGSTFHHAGPVGRVGSAAFHGPGAGAAARGAAAGGARGAAAGGARAAARGAGAAAARGAAGHAAAARAAASHGSAARGSAGRGTASHASAPRAAASHGAASHASGGGRPGGGARASGGGHGGGGGSHGGGSRGGGGHKH